MVTEATSDYWRSVYYTLQESLNLMLVNPSHPRGIRGRKTDPSDAALLARAGASRMVLASFVPPRTIRELRDVTHRRTEISAERGREIQRLEKKLEDTGMKLTSALTNIVGVSARRILDALIAGERALRTLADLTVSHARKKIPQLVAALDGTFTEHHTFMCRHYPAQIDHLGDLITVLDARIAAVIAGLARDNDIEHLDTIPGIGHTRRGNASLNRVPGTAAMAAIKQKDSYYGVYYRRLTARRGGQRAVRRMTKEANTLGLTIRFDPIGD